MSARKPISKRLRFEVLRRDDFTCRYCGAQPPDVILHLDHVIAVAKGGENTLQNLITACLACNIGKGIMDARVPAAAVSETSLMARPSVEFFWDADLETRGRPIRDARCLLRPSDPEETAPWLWEEFNSYWARSKYWTHGASTSGFSPHEAAMYAAEILHNKWLSFESYLGFIDDLMICASAGELPPYMAPFVLRALHPEVAGRRCDGITADQEEMLDRMCDQGTAVFSSFLATQHNPWRRKT